MHVPSDDQVQKALAILNDQSAGPVFIHCRRGADRTGMVVACYRIQRDGWDREKALKEARKRGMSWYQFPLKAYVLAYQPWQSETVEAGASRVQGAPTVVPAAP
jgi:protein-tyrosine phosphatase